jgi:hypothetical protein
MFYVDTSGSDENDGLSAGTAWGTVHYALTNAAFTTVVSNNGVAGNPVYLRLTSGEVFTETNAALYVSGTAAAPIVITTTGSNPAVISNYLSCPYAQPGISANVYNTLSLLGSYITLSNIVIPESGVKTHRMQCFSPVFMGF